MLVSNVHTYMETSVVRIVTRANNKKSKPFGEIDIKKSVVHKTNHRVTKGRIQATAIYLCAEGHSKYTCKVILALINHCNSTTT